jgi:glutamate--cysteine ligase
MGRLGYQSDAQATLAVSYNSLEGYASSLHEALTRPYPAYRSLGIRNPGGEYNQLATTLLQIENEFYGTIRPKRTIRQGERPLHALRERGVEYVEVRCMDLDPFNPVGISAETMRFIDVFLLHCLLSDSPPDTPAEIAELAQNQHLTAARGREPGLQLSRGGKPVALVDWAEEIIAACEPIALSCDVAIGGGEYVEALQAARRALANLDGLPSARVLKTMADDYGNSFVDCTRAQTVAARAALLAMPWTEAQQQRFEAASAESLAAQKRIEDADTMPFEVYREQYVSPNRLVPKRRAAVAA